MAGDSNSWGYVPYDKNDLGENKKFLKDGFLKISSKDNYNKRKQAYESNKKYYFGVTDGDPNLSRSNILLDVAWGHIKGSGSITNNQDILYVAYHRSFL